jgi:hypothetical protein
LAGKICNFRLLAHLTLENSKESSDNSNSGTPDITISDTIKELSRIYPQKNSGTLPV